MLQEGQLLVKDYTGNLQRQDQVTYVIVDYLSVCSESEVKDQMFYKIRVGNETKSYQNKQNALLIMSLIFKFRFISG